MEHLTEEASNNYKSYLQNNFVLKNDVYIHPRNEKALNALSKEISVTDYCLKEKMDKPFLLLLAGQSMDDYSKEKAEVFKKLHTNLLVIPIPNGYHFLPITNSFRLRIFRRAHMLA